MATKQAKHRRLAFAVVPQVLAKGIEIGNHPKHKGRDYDTVAFAAPVEINGQRGNLAVVVRKEGKNHYKVHRLVMPDGTQFVVHTKKKTLLKGRAEFKETQAYRQQTMSLIVVYYKQPKKVKKNFRKIQ